MPAAVVAEWPAGIVYLNVHLEEYWQPQQPRWQLHYQRL